MNAAENKLRELEEQHRWRDAAVELPNEGEVVTLYMSRDKSYLIPHDHIFLARLTRKSCRGRDMELHWHSVPRIGFCDMDADFSLRGAAFWKPLDEPEGEAETIMREIEEAQEVIKSDRRKKN